MENDLKQLDTDIKNWDSRIRRLEENVENVQMLTFRHVGAIDLIAKQTKCKISEDEVRKHLQYTVDGKIPFHIEGFDSYVRLGKKNEDK